MTSDAKSPPLTIAVDRAGQPSGDLSHLIGPTIGVFCDQKPPANGKPRENYRIAWSGEVLPRFSEACTFDAERSKYGKVRVKIGDSTAIDAWDSRAQQSAVGTALRSGA